MQVGDIYDAIADDTAFAALPGLIATELGARSSVIHRYAQANPSRPDLITNYFDTPFLDDILVAVAEGDDIWTNAGMATGIRNRTVAMHKLVPDATFRGSRVWNEIFRKHGDDTGYSIGIIIEADDAVLCVSAQRAWGAGAFGCEEEARLDALRVDLNRLFHTRELIRRQQGRIADLTDLVGVPDTRALLVDADLSVREASPSAAAALALGDGMRIAGGRLHCADPRVEAALKAAVRATIARAPLARTVFTCGRPSGDEPWRLRVMPTGRQAARSCVILIGPEEGEGDARQRLWLREHYGVTESEAMVAHGLSAGRSLDDIAAERGVTKNTVRAQLRALLGKTGMSRMAELVALLSRLP